jgi:Flp pilus assembly protein TadD
MAPKDGDGRGPLTPAALSLLGYLEALRSSPESLARASEYLRRAIQLDPADQQLRLRLARVLVLRNELDAATSILGPLLASSTQRDVRESP